MARLWARTVTFESINIGDELPIVIKWETKESIERLNAQVEPTADVEEVVETEPSLNPAVLRGYVKELLEKAFPPDSITAPGSRLDLDLMAPVIAEDNISLSGRVVGKREDGRLGLVECAIVIENQDGKTVGRGTAVVLL